MVTELARPAYLLALEWAAYDSRRPFWAFHQQAEAAAMEAVRELGTGTKERICKLADEVYRACNGDFHVIKWRLDSM